MKIIFKIASFLTWLLLFFNWLVPASKAQEPVYLSLFYSATCPHCVKEELFLDQLQAKYDWLTVRRYEINEYSDLLQQISQELNHPSNSVPYTVIGDEVIVGYLNDETTGKQIENIVLKHSQIGCRDIVGNFISKNKIDNNEPCRDNSQTEKGIDLKLPIFGQINTANFSLPVLTLAIAFLDGFNPCAMWVLLFLLSMLIGLKDKKKLVVLGSTFIFVSGLVYFIFLAAWLNLFFFLKIIPLVRILIGLVAIIGGALHLRDYQQQRSGCKATNKAKRQKIFNRIQNIINTRSFWLALTGISVLAISVNLLELVCSAGLPAIYTQTLSLNTLPIWQYYLYLIFYIFIFMLDDLVVFLIAIKTWHTIGVSAKFNHYSSLIGGVIIFLLGILLIFKPEWIMFS